MDLFQVCSSNALGTKNGFPQVSLGTLSAFNRFLYVSFIQNSDEQFMATWPSRYIKRSMEISGKGFLHFYQQALSLIGNQTNHRTNMFLPYYSNSCYESDYECICIVINGKICSVPLNILSSVYPAVIACWVKLREFIQYITFLHQWMMSNYQNIL